MTEYFYPETVFVLFLLILPLNISFLCNYVSLWVHILTTVPLGILQVIGAVGFMNNRLEIPKDIDPRWASIIESCWHRFAFSSH